MLTFGIPGPHTGSLTWSRYGMDFHWVLTFWWGYTLNGFLDLVSIPRGGQLLSTVHLSNWSSLYKAHTCLFNPL